MKLIATQLSSLPEPDAAAAANALARQNMLTKPQGALGRLEDIAVWLAGWQGDARPEVTRPLALVFAGNHGIAARGVSAFPGEVTSQMVANFAAGGAAINQLTHCFGAALRVIPLELDRPTADFTTAPALNEAEFSAAFFTGSEAVRDTDLLMVGEMGIGNTTAAAAICAALYGGAASRWAGPGTGLDPAGIAAKAAVIEAALAFHGRALDNPLEVLRRLGGRELAAIAGAIVAARLRRIPVILDGFVASAAAAPLAASTPGALDHCIAGHGSAEPGHRLLLERLGMDPLVDLGMRLGEASGAAVALAIVQAALATHNGMATFGEAGVSESEG